MKKLILGAVLAAATIPTVSVTADAQSWRGSRERQELRECNRELRRADSRAEYYNQLRECRRELARARTQDRRDWRAYSRYDWNRTEPGYSAYYADRYYRPGTYYSERRLSRNDRIYRGNDGRYYCRRTDGTTGLIVGGAGGALLGREIERGSLRCN